MGHKAHEEGTEFTKIKKLKIKKILRKILRQFKTLEDKLENIEAMVKTMDIRCENINGGYKNIEYSKEVIEKPEAVIESPINEDYDFWTRHNRYAFLQLTELQKTKRERAFTTEGTEKERRKTNYERL